MILDPFKSIASFSFYREVPRKSFGATAGYIAWLGVLYSMAVMAAIFVHLRPRIHEAVAWASESVPRLVLADGQLTSSLPGPIELRHPAWEGLAIVVDTGRTAAVTPAEMSERRLAAYITRDAAYVMTQNRLETYDLSKAKNEKPVVIDDEFFQLMGRMLSTALYPIAFVTTFLAFFVWKHLAALIYAVMGLLINAFQSGGLQFPELYKLSVYAQTPVVALQAAALLTMKPIPFFSLLAFGVVGVYLWQAIRQQQPPAAPAA